MARRCGVSVSEASLSYCVNELRKGMELEPLAAIVKEKFEGHEQEVALAWLRMQHRISKTAKPKKP